MVSDDFQRYVRRLVFSISDARDFCRILDDRIEKIRFKVRLLLLHHGGKAFKTTARINILMRKFLVRAVFLTIILCKDEIPNLKIAVAVAADRAVW